MACSFRSFIAAVQQKLYLTVKIGLNLLMAVELIVFGVCLFIGLRARYRTHPLQYLVLVEFEKCIYASGKLFHRERLVSLYYALNVVEVADYGTLKFFDLFC